jgi:hypothetical protein
MLEFVAWLVELLVSLVLHARREPERGPSLGDLLRQREDPPPAAR